ncbi:MAG: phosphoribosyl-ATP diphosphatase [Pseudomonadota bacterium]
MTQTAFTLGDLEAIVKERALSDDGTSYTAKLFGKGVNKCAEKLGEEATEAIIAAVTADRENLIKESADLLYHLLVVLRISEIELNDVLSELQRRTAQTGLEEKAARPSDAS